MTAWQRTQRLTAILRRRVGYRRAAGPVICTSAGPFRASFLARAPAPHRPGTAGAVVVEFDEKTTTFARGRSGKCRPQASVDTHHAEVVDLSDRSFQPWASVESCCQNCPSSQPQASNDWAAASRRPDGSRGVGDDGGVLDVDVDDGVARSRNLARDGGAMPEAEPVAAWVRTNLQYGPQDSGNRMGAPEMTKRVLPGRRLHLLCATIGPKSFEWDCPRRSAVRFAAVRAPLRWSATDRSDRSTGVVSEPLLTLRQRRPWEG